MANPTCRMIWWPLVASLVVYVVVAHVAPFSPNPDAPVPQLLPMFVVLSGGIATGSIIYRRRALAGPIQAGKLDPSTPEGFGAAFVPFLMNLVLCESIGVYGLVLTFLSGQPFYAVVFSAGAIALMIVHRPTAPDLAPPIR